MTVFLTIPYFRKNKFHFFTCLHGQKTKTGLLTLANNIVFYNHEISQNMGPDYRQVIAK